MVECACSHHSAKTLLLLLLLLLFFLFFPPPIPPTQLEIASKCGADVILNPSKCDVVEEVKKLTEGYGCEVYIEATGHPLSVKQG